MKTTLCFLAVMVGLCLATPTLAQYQTILEPEPEPEPEPDPWACTYPYACPDRVPDRSFRPAERKTKESAPRASGFVSPSEVWAVGRGDGDGSSSLYHFRISGGITNFTDLGEQGVVFWDLADGDWDYFGYRFAISENGRLYRSLNGGPLTLVGNTGFVFNALEWCQGSLFGWGEGKLLRINPNTAQTTLVGNTPAISQGDLMCSSAGLYGIARRDSGANDQLVLLNPTNGATTWTGITLPGRDFYGAEIDGGGYMYVGRQNGSTIEVYQVNLTTRVSTFAGSHPTTLGLNGMTTFPTWW